MHTKYRQDAENYISIVGLSKFLLTKSITENIWMLMITLKISTDFYRFIFKFPLIMTVSCLPSNCALHNRFLNWAAFINQAVCTPMEVFFFGNETASVMYWPEIWMPCVVYIFMELQIRLPFSLVLMMLIMSMALSLYYVYMVIDLRIT